MHELYEKTYGCDSENSAKICMEIGSIYQLCDNSNEAIDKYKQSYFTYEKLNSFQNLFEVAVKLAELYEKSARDHMSYDILKQVKENINILD
jgi:hypothetical protein